MKDLPGGKVAIVHDWLVGGGAEQVVLELHRMFPDAPIYTSYCTNEWRTRLDNKVLTGYLQYWPFSRLRKFIPFLRAYWFSHLKLVGFDVVISSSGAEAKGVKVPKGTLHFNYCHSPTHYYWLRYDEYMKRPGFGIFDPLARLGLRLLVEPMRRWDYKAAQRPDVMIANSSFTQTNIEKYYGRDSVVIHPPVDVERFSSQLSALSSKKNRSGFITAGRQTPYKRIDLAVAACTKLSLPLTVIGKGPEHRKLVKRAGSTVTFLENVANEELPQHFQSAEAFIFPGIDDFGIVAVEAMAAGTPVIAYKGGGTLDYVIPGKTGVIFEKQSVKSLCTALIECQTHGWQFKNIAIHAQPFSDIKFRQKFQELLKGVRS